MYYQLKSLITKIGVCYCTLQVIDILMRIEVNPAIIRNTVIIVLQIVTRVARTLNGALPWWSYLLNVMLSSLSEAFVKKKEHESKFIKPGYQNITKKE